MTITEYICTNDNCADNMEFIHTAAGPVCTGCRRRAVVVQTGLSPVVPYGITRQLEALDRMYSL